MKVCTDAGFACLTVDKLGGGRALQHLSSEQGEQAAQTIVF